MKTYLASIIPSIKQYSERLDDLTKLVNHHWVAYDEENESKKVYIFRENKQLLISVNGVVEIGSWDYLGNQSLLIQNNEGNFLLKHEFVDDVIIALKLDNTNRYAFFINENKFDDKLNSLQNIVFFLNERYNKNKLSSGNSYTYKIKSTKKGFNFIWGKHEILLITTSDKKEFYIYKGGNSGEHFFIDNTDIVDSMIHCKSLDDAVKKYRKIFFDEMEN
ncbi:MAG: hypothetical protein FGM54_05245 [Chitinophagaceae bacterium]|nr:hypothetical protein [Chitinophagaceae bacterium]